MKYLKLYEDYNKSSNGLEGLIKKELDSINVNKKEYFEKSFNLCIEDYKLNNETGLTSYFDENGITTYEEFINIFINKVGENLEINNNTVTLYRMLALEDESELKTPLGTSWSFNKEGAKVYNDGDYDKEITDNDKGFIVTATFNLNQINWDRTLEAFFNFYFEENEISTKKNIDPLDYSIENVGDVQYGDTL